MSFQEILAKAILETCDVIVQSAKRERDSDEDLNQKSIIYDTKEADDGADNLQNEQGR